MKCYKGIKEKNGEFARHSEIDLVAMTDCGDCPGLAVPRIRHIQAYAKSLGRDIETVHLGTCVKSAIETAQCPLEYEDLKLTLEKGFPGHGIGAQIRRRWRAGAGHL